MDSSANHKEIAAGPDEHNRRQIALFLSPFCSLHMLLLLQSAIGCLSDSQSSDRKDASSKQWSTVTHTSAGLAA